MKLLDLSKADETFRCKGCGAWIYCFNASNQVAHAPPDCAWFKAQLAAVPPDRTEQAIAVHE